MKIYIDRENILSICKMHRDDRYGAFIGCLKYELDVYFNFGKDAIVGDDIILAFLEQFTEATGAMPTFEEQVFPSRPIKGNTHATIPDKQIILLISDPDLMKCKSTGSLIIHSPEDFNLFLNALLFNRHSFDYHRELNLKDFNRWEDLKSFSYPSTDVILIDPYILNNRSIIEKNIIPLLEVLSTNKKIKLNIVLFNGNVDKLADYDKEINLIMAKIKSAVKKITGYEPNCTFVVLDSINEEHDRTIVTNYLRLVTGDSFSRFFDKNGIRKTKGRYLHIDNLAHRDTFRKTKELIKDLNKGISEIIKMRQKNLRIYGDEASNFIDFN